MIYPILNKTNITRLVKELEIPGEIDIDFVKANQGKLALHIGLDHEGKGPLDNKGIDDLLSILGFEFNPCRVLDERYNRTSKYYTFAWRNGLWTAMGNNAYAGDWTGILIDWEEKLDRKTKEDVLSYIG